jgi:hypothetical protein
MFFSIAVDEGRTSALRPLAIKQATSASNPFPLPR